MKTGVEHLFDKLGHFNRFQACLYFAAVFQAMSCGIHYLASVFLVETPKFLCSTPSNITDVLYGNHSASSLEEIWPFYTPGKGPVVVRTVTGEQWELGPCRKMLRHDTQDIQYEFIVNKSVESCSGYVFDHSQVEQSIVTEWNLVCEKEWLAKTTQPTFMLGVLIGALLFGDIADRVGRRPILMATSVCQFAFGISVAFTGNYYIFMGMRFLLAMVSSGYLVVVFVYVTEFTGSKVRTWTSMHVHAAFALGIMVVALVGYLVRVWWLYQIILTLITSPFLLYCWKFPETPFYLMAKGRHREAQQLLDTMAYWNGMEPRLKVSELMEKSSNALLKDRQSDDSRLEEPEKKLSMLNMFGSWKMVGRSATCWAIWFIGSLGYYVFSLGSVNLGGNQYINLFLAGAVELPSYLIGCVAMDRVGRRNTCAPALLLSGVACMLIIAVPQSKTAAAHVPTLSSHMFSVWQMFLSSTSSLSTFSNCAHHVVLPFMDFEILAVVLSMTGKFAIAIAFGLIYLYTCELYPTVIRSLAVGSGSMSCRIGSVVAPFCVHLTDIWIYLPQLIVGILSFIVGVLAFFLPETLGEPLTSTLEEAEALGTKSSKKSIRDHEMQMNLTDSKA